MKGLDRKELGALLEDYQAPCVSVFMPAHRKGPEIRQDPIRLKNLLGEAEEKLIDLGARAPEAREMLEPGKGLLEDADFWQHQGDGLALFLSSEFFRAHRLPISVAELVVVAPRFHIKPLLPLFAEGEDYYVLALSQNQVRLLKCNRFTARELDLKDSPVPSNIAEALWYDDPEKQLQFRSGGSVAPSPGGGKWRAIFHGHGIVDEAKEDLRRYFLKIDSGLREFIGAGGTPLVLAGVDYLLPIYSEVNRYDNLVEQGVIGNPDQARAEELQQQSWQIVEPQFRETQEQLAASYHEMLARGLASSDIKEVVPAAHHGRVDSLFVAVGVQAWGRFDIEGNEVKMHEDPQPGDEDLLDLTAVQTLSNSGRVFAVPQEKVPDSQPLAATFRY